MEYLESCLPKTCVQQGIAAAVAGVATLLLLRSLLRKKKQLSGKVVVITGASSGIGEALAHEFVRNGCKVILAARSMDKLEKLKQELIERYKVASGEISPVFIDLADHASIADVCKSMIAIYGRVDVLVNNAGVFFRSRIEDTELVAFKKVMDIDFFGQVAITKGIVPHMIEKGGGTVVAVSSLQGRMAVARHAAYGAAKHAVQSFFDNLRMENMKNNIDVLVVSPSFVATPLAQSALSGTGQTLAGENLQGLTDDVSNGMPVEYCASQIIRAIRNYETDFLLGPVIHRMMVYIRPYWPALYYKIMVNH